MINSMAEHGLNVDNLILDGDIHRVTVDGKNKRNGWYVGREINFKTFLTFGRWDTGLTVRWSSTEQLTQSDREIMAWLKVKADAEKARKQSAAAKAAIALWSAAKEPTPEHPYLVKKRITPYSIRQHKGLLIVPMVDSTGAIVNVQRIFPDGSKRFLYGGKVKGTASAISNPYLPHNSTICLCEGYATGVTIYEATGHKTIVCFNAGNLKSVAEQIRSKYPDARIYVCCDSDDVGREKGTEAAKLCSGDVKIPYCKNGGTDFNDLFLETNDIWQVANIINLPSGVVTTVESEDLDLTLQIPPAALSVPGLITDGLNACLASELPGIMQYNYPTVLSIIARAISGRVQYETRHPVFYNLKVGGTSTGKTHSSKIMYNAINRAGMDAFFGPSDFASGPGLLRSLEDQTCCLINLDEASYIFKRFDKPDQISSGKISALLELYTAAGTIFRKVYADKKQNITIKNPCVNILGNATPGIFNDLRPEDFESGLLQRFDFWYYGGPILHRQSRRKNGSMDKFVKGIKALYDSRPQLDMGLAVEYEWQDGGKRLQEYSEHVVNTCNQMEDEPMRGVVSRSYDNAIKYAMIHAASVRHVSDLYDPLTVDDLEYGILIAELLSNWKVNVLSGKVHQGKFHKNCELFKDAILAAVKIGFEAPTLKKIMSRRAALRDLSPKEIDDIERALIARGELFVDKSRRKIGYYVVKN